MLWAENKINSLKSTTHNGISKEREIFETKFSKSVNVFFIVLKVMTYQETIQFQL